MAKVVIYDKEKILIAELERMEKIKNKSLQSEYIAKFKEYKILHSISLKKQLKQIEKIFKYHKEKSKEERK